MLSVSLNKTFSFLEDINSVKLRNDLIVKHSSIDSARDGTSLKQSWPCLKHLFVFNLCRAMFSTPVVSNILASVLMLLKYTSNRIFSLSLHVI